jgi:hypothetical protein
MSTQQKSTTQASELPALEYTYTTWEKTRRRVLVGVDAIEHTGVWSVYDIPAGPGHEVGWLVQRLDGHDEKLDAAAALAGEYSRDQQRYHDGERSEHALADPLPRPVDVPLDEIRKHTALARRLARQAAPPAPKTEKPSGERADRVSHPTALAA